MSRVARLRILALGGGLGALLATASGCFLFGRGKPARDAPLDVPSGEIALSVTNHNYLDVVVYVIHDGQRTRVGMVTGSSSAIFYLPVRLLGQGHEIQLAGNAIGSEDYVRTQTLIVQPGQFIEFTLETNLRRSSVGVF